MTMEIAPRPKQVSGSTQVAVIGAGLAGLTAARDLHRAQVAVTVLEARDRVGGRVAPHQRPGGRILMRGGEFTGPAQTQLHALAGELGIGVEPLPPFADAPDIGQFVRVEGGERHVEPMPLASDPAAAEAYGQAIAQLDALAAGVPPGRAWEAENAAELDGQTIGAWLDEQVRNDVARAALTRELLGLGGPHEVSLLWVASFLSGFGGWESVGMSTSCRFVEGSAQIAKRLGDELGDRVHLATPVRRIAYGDGDVVIDTDRGTLTAEAVIIAMQPSQVAHIEFAPALPAMRDRLQARWHAGHGGKYFAVYDRPFWREEGLAGIALGNGAFPIVLDVSPSDGSEGILCALFFASNTSIAQHADALGDPEAVRALAIEELAGYFGPAARDVREFHACSWDGEHWSDGCGTGLPPGVLSTVGRALREPVGPIFWAGAETAEIDYMEGAVRSGHRAADEATARVRD